LLSQPTSIITLMPLNCLLLLFGATRCIHNCLWLQ
jgi:hypothetical protein